MSNVPRTSVNACPISRVSFDVLAEESATYDGQGDPHHLFGHVASFTRFPAVCYLTRRGRHGCRVRYQSIAVKGRLGEPALAQMEFTFAGQEAFAEQDLGPLKKSAFDEIAAVCYENILDEIRPVEQIHVLLADFEIGDIPVGSRHIQQKVGRLPAELGVEADQRASGWAGASQRLSDHFKPMRDAKSKVTPIYARHISSCVPSPQPTAFGGAFGFSGLFSELS